MKISDFVREFKKTYPGQELYKVATEAEIASFEESIGILLPSTFKEFLRTFSNGILLLGWEPIGGVDEKSPCGAIRKSERIIYDLPSEVLTEETNELVDSARLITLTMFDGGESSNDHWAFICEEGIPNNEYRIGYIGQDNKSIVKVVRNFEDWLGIFWKGNKDNKDREFAIPTFHIIYPDYDERGKILHEWLR
ncbi:SMI1/KNR4 family protein [Psychrobacillus sp. FSL K6-2684]|uniref:SMI1/KNR4 family protein n=1 Tax=unclassified Psychrobacillus TaxID=2636677 RepID=UPI0011A370C2|nr:SMI1/KNR4 family protein [Psychrobacillus sp. AK 1817]QEY19968.1 SMI1/KNR4 family protein [Psychrobacillus sp. AK 1817]